MEVANCDNCGACCQGQNFLPLTGNMLDGVRLPRRLSEPLERRFDNDPGDDDRPCVWLVHSGRCKHYEHRPSFCREFEVGGEACLRIRAEASVGVEP